MSTDTLLKFESLGNDLYAKVWCRCNVRLESGAEITHRIRLAGYNDANFFDRVNADERSGKCSNCERPFKFQWTRGGVRFRFVDTP